jgi:hypothetical protein
MTGHHPRAERRAAALRANLKRRKAQARALDGAAAPDPQRSDDATETAAPAAS